MASNKVRPTPPPAGPALVSSNKLARPALGALLFGLSGMACGDDGSDESGNDTQVPPMPATEGPMPNPTTNDPPPMIPPTSTTDESADTGTSTDGGTEIPPMPGPETTDDGTSSGGSDSGSSDSGSSSGPIPPMPPPDGGG